MFVGHRPQTTRVLETLATFNNFHRVVLCRSIATITDLLDLF